MSSPQHLLLKGIMTQSKADKLVRARAASYARAYLAKKYPDEARELYRAYLINRGVAVRNNNLIDEREVMEFEIDALPINEVEELQA